MKVATVAFLFVSVTSAYAFAPASAGVLPADSVQGAAHMGMLHHQPTSKVGMGDPPTFAGTEPLTSTEAALKKDAEMFGEAAHKLQEDLVKALEQVRQLLKAQGKGAHDKSKDGA